MEKYKTGCIVLLPAQFNVLIYSHVRKILHLIGSGIKVRSYKDLQMLITIYVADETSCIVIGCYVGRILRKDVPYYLINGIISLLNKSVIDN